MKKFFAILLTFTLCMGVFPMSAMAEGTDGAVSVTNQEELNSALINASTATTINLADGTYNILLKDGSTPNIVNEDITFCGTKDAVLDLTGIIGATWHTQDSGSSFTFDGVTVKWNEDNEGYQGFANAKKVVYKNCTISGTQFMGGDAEFINCVFEAENTDEKGYAVYGRGAGTLTFTDCNFKTDGRAIMLYQDQTTDVNVVLNNCTFSDNGNYTSKDKAVVEIGDGAYKTSKFNITINNCTITKGFESNNSNSPLWGNKDNIPVSRLTVVVDGVDQTCGNTVGHTEVATPAVAPTCTKTGLTEGKKCSACDTVIVAQKEVAKTAHTEVKDAAVAATCTAPGKTEGSHCSVCNTVIKAQEATLAAAHNFDKGVCTVCTAKDPNFVIEVKEETKEAIVSDKVVADALEEVKTDDAGNKEVVIDVLKVAKEENVTVEKGTEVAKVELPVAAVETVKEAAATLKVELTNATVTLDNKVLDTVVKAAGTDVENAKVTLQVEPVKVETLTTAQKTVVEKIQTATNTKVITLNVSLFVNDKKIGSETDDGFKGGKVKVTIPSTTFEIAEGTKLEDYTLIYIRDDGTYEIVDTKVDGKNLVVELSHMSEYAIVKTSAVKAESTTATTTTTTKSPSTGDSMNVGLYLTIFAVAVVTGGFVFTRKRIVK